MKNKLIVFEGCDGSGKSTCAISMAEEIDGIYYKTPPELFENMRHAIEEIKDSNLRFHYYLTAMLYSSREIISLLHDKHVVCDRYIYSTIAYHKALGVNVQDGLEKLVIAPDYSFCLYARDEVVKQRIKERKNLGAYDNNYELQKKVFEEFQKFPLKFYDTTYNTSAKQSVKEILQFITV